MRAVIGDISQPCSGEGGGGLGQGFEKCDCPRAAIDFVNVHGITTSGINVVTVGSGGGDVDTAGVIERKPKNISQLISGPRRGRAVVGWRRVVGIERSSRL